MNGKTLCFTGHRPNKLFGYTDRTPYNHLLRDIQTELIRLHDEGYRNVITGGAQGIDQLAFWAVSGLKQKGCDFTNIVYVPMRGQERFWASSGLFSQTEYQLMLKRADKVVYLQGELDSNAPKSLASKYLTDRNHHMVNDSDLVFGVYLGAMDTFQNERGGTAECLRYAKKAGKEILLLNPQIQVDIWKSQNHS